MPLGSRVWSTGKVLLIAGALVITYLGFAAASMRIALKAREVEVPDLKNLSVAEASGLAARLGLNLKVDDTRRMDAKVAAGRVLTQDPAAGALAKSQRNVRVWLSDGVHAATIPALVGETDRAAQLRAAQDGITLDTVAEIRSPDYPPDMVVAQTPPARSASSRVSLLVNRGERGASYVMPDLIGVNGDRAGDILRGRGFRVAVVASNPYPGVAAGIVLRQSPQGGFRIAPGEPISIEVSR
jgi:beta-lactam-binding protein with PASTA domain